MAELSASNTEVLDAYLAAAAKSRLVYGVSDCGLWLADWAVLRGWADPGAPFRGRYRTEAGCARVLRRGGGLVALFAGAFEGVGMAPTRTPFAGDIGVILTETGRGPAGVGAICTGRRWAARARTGIVVALAQPVAAWSV